MSSHKLPSPRQPRRARDMDSSLDLEEEVSRNTHRPENDTDDSFDFLRLPGEVRNHFYDMFLQNVNTAFYRVQDKQFTCIHRMVSVNKQIRREFLGRLEIKLLGKEKKSPRSIKTYVFQVQNFDFERAITVLGCNPNLMANLRSFRIKVCHVMTTATPSTTSFVKWAKFTAKYRKNLGNVNHQVIAAPAPASREDLIRNVFELKELPNITKVDKVEAENIEAGFAKWWDMGAGKYMWIKDEEIKKMGVDEAAWNKETQELREIGKHQHPDDDDSEEDELVSDSEMDGMDDDMDEDEEDAEDGDEYDSVDESD